MRLLQRLELLERLAAALAVADRAARRGAEEILELRLRRAAVRTAEAALEVMRAQMAERIAQLGAEPEVEVVLDDSWSTDRISAEGREKLRESGFAPPAPRGESKPTLVQLQSAVFRCPYCGSTDTRLENIFGPTPCRSLRYCASCRQPFEQFKTI